VGAAIARILRDPAGAVGELKVQFTNDSMKTLLRTHIEHDLRRLDQSVQAFARQLADFMQIEILNQQGQFTFFRRLLNYDDWRVEGRPQSTQFLDYQVVNSDIEAERDHLRVGDHIVRVLTMKEAITETRPLALDVLLKIPANFYVVTEWTPLPTDKARKEVNKRRRHFNMSKTGFVSQMGNDATKTNPRDVLVDESKQADIENLGDCLRALGDGQSLGDFSLTIVLYGRTKPELEQLGAEFSALRRSVSPSPLDTFFIPQSRFRFKRHFALAHARRLLRHGPRPPRQLLQTSLAPFNLHKYRARRASGFLLTAFSNATPHTFFQP
jgi:type IV secretion system protein VirB4